MLMVIQTDRFTFKSSKACTLYELVSIASSFLLLFLTHFKKGMGMGQVTAMSFHFFPGTCARALP